MALDTAAGALNGSSATLLIGKNAAGAVFAAHVNVDSAGKEVLPATDTTLQAVATALNALLAAELPYQGVVAMALDAAVTPQRALRVACTVGGNVSLTYKDGSTDVVPVNPGLSYIAGAISKVNTTGTTATATFAAMK